MKTVIESAYERYCVKVTKMFFVIAALILIIHPVATMAAPEGEPISAAGKKLVVGVLNDPPYLVKEKDGQWSGLNVDIWESIARDLNVDYEFKEMPFGGLIDALKNGTIDLSIEAFFVLAERQKLIDYSFAFGSTRLAVATLPDKIPHPWWTAVKTLASWGTLSTIGLLCLILCFLGFLFWLIEHKDNPDHFGGGVAKGIGSGIYWVASTLASGVCFGVALKSLPARLLGIVWMLVCAIALSALIASLTNSLSANRSTIDAIDDEGLRYMHLGGITGSAESITLRHIGGKYVLYADEKAALKALMKREIDGFLYDEITLQYYRDNEYRGRIALYPTRSRRFSFAFGLPAESPLRRKVNYALLRLMEKPDWSFMLQRYGLEQNFEAKSGVSHGPQKR